MAIVGVKGFSSAMTQPCNVLNVSIDRVSRHSSVRSVQCSLVMLLPGSTVSVDRRPVIGDGEA